MKSRSKYNIAKESYWIPLFVLGLNGLSPDGVLDQVCKMIPRLVAYWNFDNQSSQTVYDYSSNASNGYLGTSTSTQSNDPFVATTSMLIGSYSADLISYSDYYPFGMEMPDRNMASNGYKYGFNGKEKDNPGLGGGGTTYDYGFRIYNPNIAKFLSMDPLTKSYPWYTPYRFAGNNPIKFIDLDGLEQYDPMMDPYLMARLALTAFYDIKHSIYNATFTLAHYSAPIQTGIKLEAGYAKDMNGNEIFETEFRIVGVQSPAKEAVGLGLDLINIAAAGKLDPTDLISVKSQSISNQVTMTLKSSIIHKSTAIIKNTNLDGKWISMGRGKNGMEYQSYISGKKYKDGQIDEYMLDGVHFDGYSNGILYEAKMVIAPFLRKMEV